MGEYRDEWCLVFVYIDLPVNFPTVWQLFLSPAYCCLALEGLEFTPSFSDASHLGGKVGQAENVLLAE